MYRAPSFQVADNLTKEIICFMRDCGGPYEIEHGKVIENVLVSIATGQFFYKKECYFICFWKIHPDEIEQAAERLPVTTKTHGTSVLVAEMAMNGNHMPELRRKLRKACKGMEKVMWHRPVKNDTFKYYPSQKGA